MTGRWEISYPAHGTDWSTALALHPDREIAFGVEPVRVGGSWWPGHIIYPRSAPEEVKKTVRATVRSRLASRA